MDYEDSLIVKTAWYYYIENMTQQKISEKLGISRMKVIKLLEKARPLRDIPKELNTILIEEVSAYTDGTITEEELIERLTKRVELYLAEQS